jgi:hypothetical protein
MGTRKTITGLVIVLTVLTAIGFGISPVAAQPPNDEFANAFVISGPGYSNSEGTFDATQSPDDPGLALGSLCGRGNTVWYSFTPSSDAQIIVDTGGSSMDTTVGVYTGGPGSFSEVGCDDNPLDGALRVQFNALAGVTYSVVIGSCCGSGTIYGDFIFISLIEAPSPFDIGLTIDSGSHDKATGSASLSGTVTCNNQGRVGISVHVEQRWGHVIAQGDTFLTIDCNGAVPFTAQVWPSGSILFKGGQATATIDASGCDEFTCDDTQFEGRLKL